jgi:hypothetical protein
MNISELEIYEILKEKMDERQARALVQYIENRVEKKFEQARDIFSTKEDLFKLELRIIEVINKQTLDNQKSLADLKSEILKLIADTRSETSKLIADSRSDTSKLIADSKSETLKWLFGLIIGSTIAIIGTILTALKMGG